MTREEKIAEIRTRINKDWFAGFDLPEGWVDLVYRCHCELLEEAPDYKLTQVKEKFGGLRFYYEGAPKDSNARDIVSFYERMSYRVCDKCGTTKDVSTGGGGWVRSLCEPCRLASTMKEIEPQAPEAWEMTETDDGHTED